MCGIAGFISTQGAEVPDELIQRMTDAVAHRGPDGQGIWRSGSVALGHRRLSILDLSELGHQPMADVETGCVISYNGEIYNYRELREELVSYGCRFVSASDTEVILKAYEHWGEDCVTRFNGMWAFAIHDPRRNRVFCSRDRFGVKPFYYAEVPGGLAIGSEIRQLLPLLPVRKADPVMLFGFLVARAAEDPERTFFAGVRKLPAGHNLIFDLGSHTYVIRRHYSLEPRDEYSSLDEVQAIEAFDTLFQDAISLRLRSDVRVGTCLSGGMDSSSIATLAAASYRQQSNLPFSAITAISEDPATDESAYARNVVEREGLDWITFTPGYQDFRSSIHAVVEAQEEPFSSASIFMQYFVMREARRAGIPVLLDGQGGDETLLGYDRYFADLLVGYLKQFKLPAAVGLARGVYQNGRPGALRALASNLMYFHIPFARRIAQRDQFKIFRPEMAPAIAAASRDARTHADITRLQQEEIQSLNLPALLRYEDKNSMAHSIETRLPFLDYRLVELTMSLKTELKLRDGWGKHLLRKAMQGRMTEQILWRKHKFGFEAPESMWMGRHGEAVKTTLAASGLLDVVCAGSLKSRFAQINPGMKWRLYSTALWADRFGVDSLDVH